MKDFKIKEMFKGQVHEHVRFSVNIDGNDYNGLYNDGAINWFNPHPELHVGDERVEKIETKAYDAIKQMEQ